MSGVNRYEFFTGTYVEAADYDALRSEVERYKVMRDNYCALGMDCEIEAAKLRAEVETLREIREIASQCAANGGYLCSADLIELRKLLRKTK